MLKRFAGTWALPLLAGLLHALSIADPWTGQAHGSLQIVALALLVASLERSSSARQSALQAWLFACAWLCGSFWWLYISMHTYGGLPAPLAALAVLALAGALSLYYAAAGWAYRHWALDLQPAALRAVVFAALWLAAELARGTVFTGFGWGGSGYAHVDGILAGYAPWIGVYGIAAVSAGLAAGLAYLTLRNRAALSRQAWSGVGLWLLVFVLPWWLNAAVPQGASTGQLQVALLQGNIPQDEKFQPGSGVPMALRWYYEQLQEVHGVTTLEGSPAKQEPVLVVAPETALPLLPQRLPEGYWSSLETRYARGSQAAMIGLPMGDRHGGYTNSAVVLAHDAGSWRYDKHHLVPFGEFIPTGFKWFTQMMNIPLGDFRRGPVGAPSWAWQGQRLAPNICYEDLYGDELAARFADAEQAPTILVNLSNIAWFGDSVAIDQHLNISRMRALEFARPFVRATNTGATAIIDHRGQVVATVPRLTRAVLRGSVEGRSGLTPYARWAAHLGLWPYVLWVLLVLGGAFCWRQHLARKRG